MPIPPWTGPQAVLPGLPVDQLLPSGCPHHALGGVEQRVRGWWGLGRPGQTRSCCQVVGGLCALCRVAPALAGLHGGLGPAGPAREACWQLWGWDSHWLCLGGALDCQAREPIVLYLCLLI